MGYTGKCIRIRVKSQDNIFEALSEGQICILFKGGVKYPQEKMWNRKLNISYCGNWSEWKWIFIIFWVELYGALRAVILVHPFQARSLTAWWPLKSQNASLETFKLWKNKRRERCLCTEQQNKGRYLTWVREEGTLFHWDTGSASNSSICSVICNLVVLLAQELIYSNIIDFFEWSN